MKKLIITFFVGLFLFTTGCQKCKECKCENKPATKKIQVRRKVICKTDAFLGVPLTTVWCPKRAAYRKKIAQCVSETNSAFVRRVEKFISKVVKPRRYSLGTYKMFGDKDRYESLIFYCKYRD